MLANIAIKYLSTILISLKQKQKVVVFQSWDKHLFKIEEEKLTIILITIKKENVQYGHDKIEFHKKIQFNNVIFIDKNNKKSSKNVCFKI